MKEKIEHEKLFDVKKGLDIKAYPFFNIKVGLSKKEISNDDLYLETAPNFFIIKYDSVCYYIEDCVFWFKKFRLKRQLQSNSPYKAAINLAESKSNSVFLLYSKGTPVIGYIEKNEIKFIDTDLKSFNSLQSFIEYRFGSIEGFKSEIQRYNFENQYLEKIRTFDDAKLIFKNYGFNYMKYNIYDTISLANAIIFEVGNFVKITDYQKKELKKELIKVIKDYEFGKKDMKKLSSLELVAYVEPFKSIIKQTLEEVLLFNQYWDFVSNEELYQNANEKSEDIIKKHFKNEQNINNDSVMNEIIIKEIFK